MPSTGRILYILGAFLMLLCVIDAVLFRVWRIDVTGYRYAAFIVGAIGLLMMNFARFFPAITDDETE